MFTTTLFPSAYLYANFEDIQKIIQSPVETPTPPQPIGAAQRLIDTMPAFFRTTSPKPLSGKPALLINTLPLSDQTCLIQTTLPYDAEEVQLNALLTNYEFKSHRIYVYGRNANDPTAEAKCQQLVSLGFQHVYVYRGGLFEWLLLQDIYGASEFPTTRKVLDLLQYR